PHEASMKIVVAGATGFLGRPLTAALLADGHDVVALTRRATAALPVGARRTVWTPGTPGAWQLEIDGAGAVINLAGESIAAKRWTATHKRRVLESRIASTRGLVEASRAAAAPPPIFVSGSAVGYYGP